MDRYDLELAFYRRMIALTYSGMRDVRTPEIFNPEEINASLWRRGVVLHNPPETICFGNGVYSRMYGFYQIDIFVGMKRQDAFEEAKKLSDMHVTHFFPTNGRGLALTENTTQANIDRRPTQRSLGREGDYFRELIEVDFYVDIPATV